MKKFKALQSLKLLFTISLFVSQICAAQTVVFKNKETDKPIPGLLVFSSNNSEGVLSNEKGEIDLSVFPKDNILFVRHLSYNLIKIQKSDLIKKGEYLLVETDRNLNPIYVDYPLRYLLVEEDEPGQIHRIDQKIVKLENPATSADMLQNTGGVLVQKSQGGGGSPIIRGFEANKLLLVIDGIRMNNAIYRSGHLQNSITIDNSMLDHTEILFGPSSSLYGSDALGGVIHFHTLDPEITNKDSLTYNGAAMIRYTSNNDGKSGHFHFSLGKKNWGLLTSVSAGNFGDSRMGSYRAHGYNDFAYHRNRVATNGTTDTMLVYNDSTRQYQTGYTQFDIMEKFVYEPTDKLKLTLNFQYSTSTEIHRYDKLTEYIGSNLKWAEWYYGPQSRLLAAMKLNIKPQSKIMDNGAISVSYQKIDEDRVSRQFQSLDREYQREDVNVIGLNTDFAKIFTRARMIFYGAEIQHNIVSSTAETRNILSETSNDGQTRYPNTSQYLSSGVYFQFKQKFKNRNVLTTGVRYSLIYANSDFKDTSFIQLPFNQVSFATSAPSGHFGMVFNPDSLTVFKTLLTSGFRAPNIDDYGKVFEKGGFTIVPNDNIKPEYALGFDLSANRSFGKEFLELGGTVYASYLFNAIVRRDFTLNGNDSVLYNGEMTKVQANVNTDKAFIAGASAHLKVNFTEKISFYYSYNYTFGRDLANQEPLSHIAPQFGKISLSYNGENLNMAAYSLYNFRKELQNYGSSTDNLDLTPNGSGTPPWMTLNARVAYTLFDLLTFQFSCENILDVHYRQFASGISAPGRNFLLGLRAKF